MILHLDRQPHDAVAAIDSSGHILKYSELLSFRKKSIAYFLNVLYFFAYGK